eukprot:919775_1
MRCSKLLSDSDSGVQDDNDHTHCIVTTFNFALSITSRWFLYLYYIHRINLVFSGSIFALSGCKYKCMILYISVGHVLAALFFVIIRTASMCNWSVLLYALSFPLLNDLTVSAFCLWYFMYKL